MASSGVALEDIPSVDIMTELLHRFKCSSKPDKRLILVGNIYAFILQTLYVSPFFSSCSELGFCFSCNSCICYMEKSSFFLGLR